MPVLVSPVIGRVTSPFDPARKHPVDGTVQKHLGTDFRAPLGARIRALADGVVIQTRSDSWPRDKRTFAGRTGNRVKLRHGLLGVDSYAGHTGPLVAVGDRVSAGQVIGLSDGTGNVSGAHLHLEIEVKGVPVDPVPWARKQGLELGVTDRVITEEDDMPTVAEIWDQVIIQNAGREPTRAWGALRDLLTAADQLRSTVTQLSEQQERTAGLLGALEERVARLEAGLALVPEEVWAQELARVAKDGVEAGPAGAGTWVQHTLIEARRVAGLLLEGGRR